ncbi:SPW repeat domain-containing protein [Halegenticoccus soli]|uniref:SPW repeat domain-containing protein n=1 Tax=Halegenticoccus soli TaxID=1985678 RepID=UPI000C6D3047|nr:SPW repeat protein [Halegenticoccus soli]
MTETTKWLSAANALLGLWLIVAPFIYSTTSAGLWNDVIVGALVASIGAYNYYLTTKGKEVSATGAGANTLLGLWMIAAPFVLGVSGAAFWSDLAVGVLVASFAGYNAYVSRRGPDAQARADHAA